MHTRLPDIHGWLEDMHSARELVQRLIQNLEQSETDRVVGEALSCAALVRYSRCFTTGSRERLTIAQLASATETDINIHERLRGVRDWHLAHPVNEQEVHAFHVILDGESNATTGAIGFSSLSSAEPTLRMEEAHAVVQLCEKWIAWLTQIFVDEQALLLPLANELSRDQLLLLPQDEPEPNQNIRARRRQTKK